MRSLRIKLSLVLICFATIALLVVGFYNYQISKQNLIQKLEQQMIVSVKNASGNLSDWLSVRKSEAEVISRNPVFVSGTNEERLAALRSEASHSPDKYVSLGYADLNGNMQLTTGGQINIADEPNFKSAAAGFVAVSDPLFGKGTSSYIIVINVPVLNDDNRVTGVLNIALDAMKVFKERTAIDATSFHPRVHVIRTDGLTLYSSIPDRILNYNFRTQMGEGFERLDIRDSGVINLKSDVPVKSFYSRMTDSNWFFVISIPLAEFDAPVWTLFYHTFGILLLADVVLGFFLYWIVNVIIVKPLRKVLTMTEAVAGGHFYTPSLPVERDDELGQLAGSVNKMSENLRDLFEPFESFIKQSGYAMIVTDRKFTITSFNEQASELLGYSPESVVRKMTPMLWLQPAQLEERAARYSEMLGEKIEPNCSVLVVKTVRKLPADDEWLWVNSYGNTVPVQVTVSTMSNHDGSVKGYVLLAKDIREQKESIELKNRLQAIVESAHDFIASFDHTGTMFYMNSAGKKLLGIGKLDETSNRLSMYVDERTVLQLDEGLELAKRQGYWETETLITNMSGAKINVSLSVVPHFNKTGEPYYSTIVRDITDLKQSQHEMLLAKQEAEEANRTKSMFLAGMSHEIRTPLNGIIGLAYLLERTGMNRVQKDYVEKMTASAQNLLHIINDVLDFSKLEANKLVLEATPFQLEDLIEKLSGTVSVLLGHKPVDFIIRFDQVDRPALVGDSLRLYQVLLNFVSNAIKFTEQGFIELRIALAVTNEQTAKISFTVKDTGIGMSADQVNKLFQPFVQGDGSTNRKYGGTGLGLVIAGSLIEMMGGTLSVRSTLGQGSRFSFVLPFPIQPAASRKSIPLPLRVLVAEDRSEVRETFLSALEPIVAETAAISSWHEAARVLQVVPIDVVILDMEAEDMYGEHTWREMKQIADKLSIRTVVYTTLSGRDAMLQLPNEWRPDAVLVKPFTPKALYNVLRQLSEETIDNSESSLTPALAPSLALQSARHIMVVDDNEINRIVAQSMIEMLGYRVIMAADGYQACKLLLEHRCELIFMDLHMPELGGIETTRYIRSIPRYADVPVIALTADMTPKQHEECLNSGMNDVLTKPIDPDRLEQAVNKWLVPVPNGSHTQAAASPAVSNFRKASVPGILVEEGLAKFHGKSEPYFKLLGKLRSEYSDVVPRIARMTEQNDRQQAVRLLHTLRGAAGNLSAYRVFEAAGELEDAVAKGEEELSAASVELQRAIDEMAVSIELLLSSEE